MPLRFLEVRIPADLHDEAEKLADGHPIIDSWCLPVENDSEVHQYLLESQEVESLVDALRSSLGDDNRIIVMPVEATMPRVPEAEEDKPKRMAWRVSREELNEDIGERVVLTPPFIAMAALSSVVACIGLVRNDVVALIGAMVIAPLLGPNMALALGTTLGDVALIRKALRTGLVGIGVTFLVALALGPVLDVTPTAPQIASRIEPDFGHLALALASGIAGGLAFTTGAPASLIGVMVAVALLPPLAAGGMLLSSGHAQASVGTFVLLGTNLVAVNLAGIATFLAQGIRPLWSSDKDAARRSAWRAFILWGVLLAMLAVALGRIQGAW